MQHTKWITKLVNINNNLTLNNIILPGTHNSGSYQLKKYIDLSGNYKCASLWPVSKIIKNWTLNQKYNILEQLKMGVRILDLDISFYNDKFYISHTFIIEELENVLKQLVEFNSKYGDLYVLKIVYRYNIKNTHKTQLNSLFYKYFQHNYINPDSFPEPLTAYINDFYIHQKNMLIYMDGGIFYDTQYIYSDWPDKQTHTDCIEYNKLQLYNIYFSKKNYSANTFIDMNWTLTPTATQITNSIKNILLCSCCCTYYNLETWIYHFNNKLIDFISSNKDNIHYVNSISLDFITTDIINDIIQINNNTNKIYI